MIDSMDDAELERALAAVPRISPADARAMVDSGRAVLIDIRDASGYQNAHIKGAQSLPAAVIDATGVDLPADLRPSAEQTLILYCA